MYLVQCSSIVTSRALRPTPLISASSFPCGFCASSSNSAEKVTIAQASFGFGGHRFAGLHKWGELKPRAGKRGGGTDLLAVQQELDANKAMADIAKDHFS